MEYPVGERTMDLRKAGSRTILGNSFLSGCAFLTTPPNVLERMRNFGQEIVLVGGVIPRTNVHKLCL